jgi:putative mRNA 3-end processing factor
MAKPIVRGARSARSFSYRAGVRVRDSVLACDATAGGDLIFLSNAGALEGPAARRLPSPRGGRRKILTTEVTLALAGASGERLRPYTLIAAYGRPFNLGGMRLELFQSGSGHGAASLLCERDGDRLVYSGPVGAGTPTVRVADALCLDGTYGSARFAFPSPEEALAGVLSFVRAQLAAGRAPVVLAHPRGPLLAVATELDRAGIALRAHRSVMAAAATHRSAGLTVPGLLRFAGTLGRNEALLWPPEGRDAPLLNRLTTPAFLLAAGAAADPTMVAAMRVDAAIPLSAMADFAGLLRYVDATGPREVAVIHAGDGDLCHALRLRGIDAYPVGPPEQISLF